MNLLLDAHVLLWWDADATNQVFVSAASILEIGIKRRLGKLEFRGAAAAAIGANGFHEMPILPIDAEAARTMAWRHNDPFDCMLVAQARRLTFTLATADSAIRDYPHVAQIWAS